jgi:predicted nucleotidyltransferase
MIRILAFFFFGFFAASFSGGEENLSKRYRPSYRDKTEIKKYEEVEEQVRWFVEEYQMLLGENEQLYLFGSWTNDGWWFQSDVDIGFPREITERDKRIAEYVRKKFKIKNNFELRRVNPEDRNLIKVEIITF